MSSGWDEPQPPLVGRERWLPVFGWEGLYEVSDHGQVCRLARTFVNTVGVTFNLRPRIVKGSLDRDGYRAFQLRRVPPEVSVKGMRAHVLVLEAFVGPRPDGMQGCHNDGNPGNNHLSNLRWDTPSGNRLDMATHGTDPHRQRTRCPREHDLAEPNLVPAQTARGQRCCLACARAHNLLRVSDTDEFRALADSFYEQIMRGEAQPIQRKAMAAANLCESGRHLMTEDNIRVNKRRGFPSTNLCKACANERAKLRYYAKKRVSA